MPPVLLLVVVSLLCLLLGLGLGLLLRLPHQKPLLLRHQPRPVSAKVEPRAAALLEPRLPDARQHLGWGVYVII